MCISIFSTMGKKGRSEYHPQKIISKLDESEYHPQKIIMKLDERIFGINKLATKLFKYFIVMGLLMVLLGPALDIIMDLTGLGFVFLYLSLPSLVILILLGFILYSTWKIYRPIKHILNDIRGLQEGNFDVSLDAKGYLEIESLTESIRRMRNSLVIATNLLGERDTSMDQIAVRRISHVSTVFAMIIPFLVYSILLTIVSGVVYSPMISNTFSEILPMYDLVQMLMVMVLGVLLAFGFGYTVAYMIGRPIHKLALAAEKVSKGDLEADFKIRSFGDIQELSVRLHDLRDALKRAIKEIEEEGVV